MLSRNASFNPRSRVGSDVNEVEMFRFWDSFQSTLPRGERPGETASSCNVWVTSFQSTLPRGGATWSTVCIANHSEVSIHAPAWGATA